MKKLLLIALLLYFAKDIVTVKVNTGRYEDSRTYIQYLGSDKLTVVNVWAPWCEPCVAEIPFLNVLKAKYANVNFLSLSKDKDTARTQKSMREHGFLFEEISRFDYQFKEVVESKLNNQVFSVNELPITYLVRNGKVVAKFNGSLDSLQTVRTIERFRE